MPAQTVIQVRRDTAANWASSDPALAEGEVGYETDTGKFKIGKKVSNELLHWLELDYATDWANVTDKPTLGTAASKDVAATGDASDTQVVLGNDSRLDDSRTPTSHASTHTTGGSDVITVTSGMIANGAIINEDISDTAAIAQSKISGLTADLGAKVTNPMTAVGDLIIGSTVTSGVAAPVRLGIGASGRVLTSNGNTASWEVPAAGSSVSGTLADNQIVRLDGNSGSLQNTGLFISDSNILAKPAAEVQRVAEVSPSSSGIYNNYTFDMSLSNYFSATINQGTGTGTPSVVATSQAAFGSSATGTLTLPAQATTDDIVIVSAASDGSQPTTTSTGWTVYSSGSQGTLFLTMFIKRMGTVPDTSIALAGMSTASSAVATTYRGVAAVSVPVLASTTGTGNPDPAAVTTTVNNSLVVVAGGLDDDTVTSVTAPTNYSNLVWQFQSGAVTSMMASRLIQTAGAEDPGAFATGQTDDWAAYTVILAPGPTNPRVNITKTPSQTLVSGSADAQTVILALDYTAGTITWDSKINWGSNGAPSLVAGNKMLLSLVTVNGTEYRAALINGY